MMIRRNRLLHGAIVAALAVSASACGGDDDDTASPSDTAAGVSAAPATTQDGAAATTDGTSGTAAPDGSDSPSASAPGTTQAQAMPDAIFGGEIHLEDAEDPGEPQHGGVLRLMLRLDADKFDPHVATDTTGIVVGALTYEGLVENFRGEIKPALAESWEISEDLLTYTFTLRDNATFHSGRAVTAADVVYSLNRVMDPATGSPNIGSYAAIASVEASDDHTVVIGLSRPHAPLLYLLSALSSSVVDSEAVESGGVIAAPSGGTGPFVLTEHNVGRNIVLTANDQYWVPEFPYLDGIDITWNPDDNARAAAIRSNSVDVLFRPAPEFIESLKSDPALKWYGGSGSLSLHLLLNASVPPFDDVRVRQAVFHALDRQVLLDVANSGLGLPLNGGFLPPDRLGGLQEPVYGAPDIDRAKALLAEAGYPDGFDAELTVIGTSAFQVRQAEVEQQQLAEIGINITINPVEAQVATEMTRNGDFEMYQSGFGLRADPDERFTAAFTTEGGLNYSNWSDPEFDALIEQARTEGDLSVRAELYEQADRILAERGPAAFTILTADFDVVAEDVMGFRADPTPSFGVYKHLWFAQD